MTHKKPAQLVAEYVTTDDCPITGEDMWKHLEAVRMMVDMRNTDRIAKAIARLEKTILKTQSEKTNAN